MEGALATVYGTFMDGLFEVLCTADEEVVGNILEATFGYRSDTLIPLVCEDLTTSEALTYARTLFELGQSGQARELLTEVVRHAAGELPPALMQPQQARLAA
ncbi:MAG: hypothetical protein ACJAZO_005166 [Myxococcota bacterium]|jgi:hypothetical protein